MTNVSEKRLIAMDVAAKLAFATRQIRVRGARR
jgi:hypothetical protein